MKKPTPSEGIGLALILLIGGRLLYFLWAQKFDRIISAIIFAIIGGVVAGLYFLLRKRT